MRAVRSIVHPTDFSQASMEAFVHALRIGISLKSHLSILHVAAIGDKRDWTEFPHVRALLARWGMMEEHEPTGAIYRKLGIVVSKIELASHSTTDAILQFLDKHPADLMVLATEARQGVARWLNGSVAEKLARHAKTPVLFVPNHTRGFVDPARGEVHLKRVLIPVDHEPKPGEAASSIMAFVEAIAGVDVEQQFLHVGHEPPPVPSRAESRHPIALALRHGDVVDKIIHTANEWQPDLIAMPTAGHNGILDALRGSTTERVLRRAPCPVLAVPVAASAKNYRAKENAAL